MQGYGNYKKAKTACVCSHATNGTLSWDDDQRLRTYLNITSIRRFYVPVDYEEHMNSIMKAALWTASESP
jgi:hypothetical protein